VRDGVWRVFKQASFAAGLGSKIRRGSRMVHQLS
jgi:hypothetical protein